MAMRLPLRQHQPRQPVLMAEVHVLQVVPSGLAAASREEHGEDSPDDVGDSAAKVALVQPRRVKGKPSPSLAIRS